MVTLTLTECPTDMSYILKEYSEITSEQLYTTAMFFHHLINTNEITLLYCRSNTWLCYRNNNIIYYLDQELSGYYSSEAHSLLLYRDNRLKHFLDNQEPICYQPDYTSVEVNLVTLDFYLGDDTIAKNNYQLTFTQLLAYALEYISDNGISLLKTDNWRYRKQQSPSAKKPPVNSLIDQFHNFSL